MNSDDWRQVAQWLQAADIDCIEFATPGRQVRMLRGPAGYAIEDRAVAPARAAPAAARGSAAGPPVAVIAQGAGVFLAGHPARPSPLVAAGDRVQQGDVIGLLQVGQLLAPVVAPASGSVVRVLVATGSPVDDGTRLVEIQAGGT
jgi:acetyl-CoA carboxylase biotin carboxyl carrier protein